MSIADPSPYAPMKMKTMLPHSLLGLVTAACLASSNAQEPALTPEASKAAEKMKEAFPDKPKFRTRGVPSVLTRSGSVIRHRGPVPTLVPLEAAAKLDAQGSPPAGLSSDGPPAIPKGQVDLVTTGESAARVDPEQNIAFDNILFDLDSATVRPESREIISGIAQALKTMPERRFLVEGHTCDLGDDNGPDHNIRLSCLRAEAVCAWLIHFGALPSQLQPMGFGSKDPLHEPSQTLSKAANEPIRAQNRRAAFRLLVK
jgi:peptidoglycan-associated lipoprotein